MLERFGYMEEKDAIFPNRQSFWVKISRFSDAAGNIWTERVSNWLWHPQREELLGARRSFMAICPFHLAEVVKYSKKKLGK